MAKVEGILEQVGERLGALETRLNHLEARMDSLDTRMATEFSQVRQEMNANNREMRTHFRWILGIMLGVLIPMWVTIILAILFNAS